MIRTLLVAGVSALALTVPGAGVALAANATGPGSAACAEAGQAVTDAQKVYNDAKAELDKIPAADQTAADKAKVDDAKRLLASKKADQSKACGSTNNDRDRRHDNNHSRYNSCNDYRSHGIRELARSDARYNAAWDHNHDGWACRDDDVVVSANGDCVTFKNENRDYGTRYNNRVNALRNDARRSSSDGGSKVTRSERDRINNAADVRDFRNHWTHSRDELRTICNDPTPEVVIVGDDSDDDDSTTVTTVTEAPPAPVNRSSGSSSSGGQVSVIPSGSVDTGDGSTEL